MDNTLSTRIVKAVFGLEATNIWQLDETRLSPGKRRLASGGRWALLVVEGVARDALLLRASALTFTTILSIVPFLAVAFSVLKGIGFQNKDFIRDLLMQASAGREQVVDHIITYINQTNVKTLGGLGMGLLLFTVISLLSNIEASFNRIWGVERGRSLGRKTTDYFSVSLIFPVLIVTAISFTATLQSNTVVQKLLTYSVVSEIYLFIFRMVPYISVWLALTFLFMFIPNTRVRFLPALGGGVLAGTAWQLAQWAYITFQIGAAKYNAIYGSFAQFPLFLVWVYMSWVIILLGAEMSFAFQNLRTREIQAKYRHVSTEQSQRFGLAVLLELAATMHRSGPPPALEDLADTLGLPLILVRDLLLVLEQEDLAAKLDSEDGRERYGCIKSPDAIRVLTVMHCFSRHNASDIDTAPNQSATPAMRAVDRMLAALETHEANATLAALMAGRMDKRAPAAQNA
ncbi:MAG: YihY/virulence factor BrkB family protein [Desulfovibrionaceae bacterium]